MTATPTTAEEAGGAVSSARVVLALNSGSSSLKFGLYRVSPTGVEVLLADELAVSTQAELETAFQRMARQLASAGLPAPAVVGHRLVHGGPHLRQHCPINAAVLAQLEAAIPFAPLHLPAALSVLRLARQVFSHVPQVACFDTCFHATLPEVARVLALPQAVRGWGIERYGFHGLSVASIVQQLAHALPRRLVVAHLGNGASVTAVLDGRSVDTSMGLTPCGGVPMGTRSGDLDPGVLLYLLREKHFDADMLEDLVNRRSGLLGLSGLSNDMRELHDAAPTNANARLAIDVFCQAVRKQVAAMVAVLGGLDALVFTGGIGEHDALVRQAICAGLDCVGVRLEPARNQSAGNPISQGDAPCRVLVLPSREDEQIARHAWALLGRLHQPSWVPLGANAFA